MKSSIISIFFATAVSAHSIFQRVSVNGADQGLVNGVRSPNSNNPIQNVQDGNIACNTGLRSTGTVINIPAGAQVGANWGHIIGGAQVANDPDNPIAKSHKGPIQAYLAKVDNAASAGTSGLNWFKVAHEGLDTSSGLWAVDHMISQQGWWYFTMPSCVPSGQYLLRIELLALHSASKQGQAQFYMACAQINITGGGSLTSPATVQFPGAYTAQDKGILISIYDTKGNPNNGLKPYDIPGPAPITC